MAQRYQTLFDQLDWTEIPELAETQSPPGRLPHPETAYIKAYLVMIEEKLDYMTELWDYLSDHPALIWMLGFRLIPDPTSAYAFDIARSLPSARHLRRKLGALDKTLLDRLLRQTVQQAVALIPALGTTVSVDVKHIYAYVKENNPRTYVKERYDPRQQPNGDPDCRLGFKPQNNQGDEKEAKSKQGEWLWGYGTGVAVSQTPDKDAIVLAEYTQPFNENDVTYGRPLSMRAQANLGFVPHNFTADAAFDAWHMYEGRPEGGIAAIPLNLRGHPLPILGEQDRPICLCNEEEMQPKSQWIEKKRRVQRFECRDCGKRRKMGIEVGHIIRLRLDRQAEDYKAIYRQRTATERINSQAAALGIDHPRQRTGRAIARRNTLIYIIINIHAIQRYHKRNRDLQLSSYPT